MKKLLLVLMHIFLASQAITAKGLLKADFRHRPPEMVVDGQSISGPLKDIIEEAAQQIGYNVQWRISPFSKSLAGLKNGSVDIVPRTIRNEAREAFVNYLGPISIQRKDIHFLVRNGHGSAIKSYIDIKNLRIGAKSKTAYFSRFDKDTSLKKVLIDTDEKLANLFLDNKVDAIIVLDRAPLEKALAKQQFKNYEYAVFRHAQNIGNYYGMSKKSAEKQAYSRLNRVLLDMVARGKIDSIYKKHGITKELSDNNPNNLTEVERIWLKNNPGPFRVHNEMDWPPLNYNEDGKATGYSIDYMDLLARKLGLQIEYISGPDWNSFLDMMRQGKLDIMLNIAQNQDRAKYLHFTKPFVTNDSVIVTRKDEKSIKSLDDLAGKTVALPNGFFQQGILEKSYPKIKLHLVKNQRESLLALSTGTVDAVIGELAVQNYLIAKNLLTNLKIAAIISRDIIPGDLRLAVHKDQEILRDILQKGMKGISQAEFLALNKKWFGEALSSGSGGSKRQEIRQRLTEKEKIWLDKRHVIRARVGNNPPFQVFDGEPKGAAVDYLNLIAKRAGLKVKYITDIPSWTVALENIKNRQVIDLLLTAKNTLERQKTMVFTKDYILAPYAIFSRKDATSINTIENLNQLTVSVEKNYVIHKKLLTEYPKIKLLVKKTSKESIQAVALGAADAYIGNLVTTSYHIQINNLTNLKVAGPTPFENHNQAMAIRNDWPELAGIINKTFDTITPQEHKRIRDKWISTGETDEKQKDSLTPQEQNWLKKNRVWKVANELDWPPFDFAEDGVPKGYTVELVNLALERIGVTVKWINGYTWAELMQLFKKGDIDILPAIFKTEARKKYIAYTFTYASNPSVLITHTDNNDITSLEAMNGKKMASISGFSIADEIAKHYPEIEQVFFKNAKEALLAVSKKRVDAFVGSIGTSSYIMDRNYIPDVKVVGDSGLLKPGDTALYMGVLKERSIQRDILQKALNMISEKEMERIQKKWLSLLQYQKDRKGKVKLSSRERDWLLENSEFNLGDSFTWPPFSFLDENGKFGGVSSGYVDIISDRLGITFKPTYGLKLPEVIAEIRNESIDVIPAVIHTEELARYLDYTKPYYRVPVVIATRRTVSLVDSLKDLSDKKVGILKGYATQEQLSKNYPEISLVLYDGIGPAIQALESQEIDAYVGDLASLNFELAHTDNQRIKIAAPTEFHFDLHIGVRKELPHLVPILNKAIDSIDDQERDRIKNTWMAIKVSFGWDLKTILTYAIPIIISILLIIGFVLVWNRRLSKVIQERERLYKELHIAEQTLNIALEASNTGIWTYNFSGEGSKNVYMSDQWYKQVGYTRDDFKEDDDVFDKIIHSDDKESAYQAIQEHEKGNTETYEAEFRMIAKDGSYHWILSKGQAVERNEDGIPLKLTGAHLDITERKIAEAELQNLQQTLNIALEASNTGIWKINPTTNEALYYGDQWFRQLGYVRDDFSPDQNVFDLLLHPEDKEVVYQTLDNHVSGKTDLFQAEFRFKAKDESWKWIQTVGKIVEKDENGVPTQMTGVHIDITKRKKAEDAAKETRDLMQTLIDSVHSVVFVKDTEGRHLLANSYFMEIFEKTMEEVIGKTDIDIFSEDTGKAIMEIDRNVMKNRESTVFEMSIPHPDGSERIHLTEKLPLINTQGEVYGMCGLATDITHQKEIEADLIASHKKITDSIQFASMIQNALLPEKVKLSEHFDDAFIIWEPKDVVGGDIFFFEVLRDGNELLLFVIDCTGHGVPGAFVTALVKAVEEQIISLMRSGEFEISPAKVLGFFNRSLKRLLKQETETAASNAGFDGGVLHYNKKDKKLKFAGAETPLFIIQNGDCKTIKGDRHSIGYKKSKADFKFKNHEIEVHDDTTIYLTTDGYLDQNGGGKGYPFGKKRFKELLLENYNKPFAEQKSIFLNAIKNYQAEEERNDDMTMVGLKIHP